jgi:hypothetical protein
MLAADPNPELRPQAGQGTACGLTTRNCERLRWLRGADCCAGLWSARGVGSTDTLRHQHDRHRAARRLWSKRPLSGVPWRPRREVRRCVMPNDGDLVLERTCAGCDTEIERAITRYLLTMSARGVHGGVCRRPWSAAAVVLGQMPHEDRRADAKEQR